jgi:hypothetical protein
LFLCWIVLGSTVLALLGTAWDREARFQLGALYCTGLLAIGLALHQARLSPAWLYWSVALALAAYVLLTALLRRMSPRLAPLGQFLQLPPRSEKASPEWFLPAQCVLAGVVTACSLGMSCTFDTFGERAAGPLAVLAVASAAALLAGAAPGRWSAGLRHGTLSLGVVALAEAAWSAIGPGYPAAWLHRNVCLMASLAVMTGVYGAGLRRLLPRQPEWIASGRWIGPVLGALASVCLLGVLGQEFVLYDRATQHTPLVTAAVVLIIAALVGLIAAMITFAVQAGRDPFNLSERGRTLYVYVAEMLLVLLFVHLRLNVPALFRPFSLHHWPMIVMGIAFAGVGVSEYLRRRGLRVLAEPLERTGVFLPLLPLLAFWARPPAELGSWADQQAPGLMPLLNYLYRLPHDLAQHALLWFTAGLLYALLAVSNRSFRYAFFAALAANFSLWALWAHEGIAFLAHPQLWLIPLSLIVLVAEHLNRDRLLPAQSAALRYAALGVLYVSSTADMFIAGLGNSVIWPLVLALLAISGVLTGIVLRVRAFLFQGVAFLFLVVFAQIWHAAVDRQQTWIWWVSGIVLGAAILTLFAVFEKRRQDVLRLVEEIRRWE